MRRIIFSGSQDRTPYQTARSISFQHKRTNTNTEKKCLTSRQNPKVIIIKQQSQRSQMSSLALISKQQYQSVIKKKNHDNISIQDEFSPGMYSQRTSSQYQQNMQSYISSKKSIYKLQSKQNYQQQVTQYNSALKQMIYRNDQNELMDFDKRYLRLVRQKRLREIVHFLLKKSKEQQISLQDIIDNKITQNKPYQQSGSFTFLFYVRKGILDKIEQMLQVNQLYVHDFDEKQMTSLHIATQKQNVQLIKMLLSYGANIMSKDLSGNSALNYAINSSQFQIIQVLNLVKQQLFLSIQSPSDTQYLAYLFSTRNIAIQEMVKLQKLNDILVRCTRYVELQNYVSKLKRNMMV